MKKTILKTNDFFSLYRSSQFRKYSLSGGIAICAAFVMVSFYHGDIDTRGLMASVASVTESPRLEADLILKQQGQSLSVVFGAKALKVDRIDFTLLSDPTRFHSLTASSDRVTITGQQEIGAYHVSINMQGVDITPGIQVADLIIGIEAGVPLALTDTEFVSNGQRYNMTGKVE